MSEQPPDTFYGRLAGLEGIVSEITLRNGTVVRHFVSKSERQRDWWEVEYPDGERVREMTDKPLHRRNSRSEGVPEGCPRADQLGPH